MEDDGRRFVHKKVTYRDLFEQAVLFVLDPQLPTRPQFRVERASRAEQLCSHSHVRAADRRFLVEFRAIERRTPPGSMIVKRQRFGMRSL
jgi:hypothetical protein